MYQLCAFRACGSYQLCRSNFLVFISEAITDNSNIGSGADLLDVALHDNIAEFFVQLNGVQFYLNITHKSQQRDKKTLAQATKSICPQEYLRDFLQVLDNMSDTTIINYISEIANFRLKDDVDTPNTKIYFYYGTAVNELLAKKSAQVIAKNYSGSVIKCFKGKGHCENALLHPDVMIQELDRVLI